MRIHKTSIPLTALLIVASSLAYAQDQNTKNAIVKALVSQYALTKPTADLTDIVTAGAVVVLQKDNLLMVATTSQDINQNTYKDGKIQQNAAAAVGKFAGFGSHIPGFGSKLSSVPSNGPTRTFVTGEKMWVTNIDIRNNAIVLDLFTDAFGDNRFKASLAIPFPKGPPPTPDQAAKLVSEVLTVQPSDDAPADAQQQGPAGAAPAAQQTEAPPAPIAPPPPPADEPPPTPKTVSLKETKDLVIADFGQPDKIVKLGTKEIDYYKDFKVTFVAGKVTDVQ